MIYEPKTFTVKNGLEVTLRSPELSDAAELLNFIKNACGQTPFQLSTPEDFSFTVEQEESFIQQMREGSSIFICACVDGKIIGDCNVDFRTHVKDRHRGLVGICIDIAFCNCGIGSVMIDEMIRLSKEKPGIEQLELEVLSGNDRAIHLYEKKGFAATGIIPKAIKQPDGIYRDSINMTRFLYEENAGK